MTHNLRTLMLAIATTLGGIQLAEAQAPVAAEARAGHDRRLHFVQWCQRCEQWSCSDCGQSCGCPPVVAPGVTPLRSRDCTAPAPMAASPSDLPLIAPDRSPLDSMPPSGMPDAFPIPPADDTNGLGTVPTPMTPPDVTSPNAEGDLGNRPSANQLAGLSAGLGAAMGAAGAPNMIGDAFGGAPGFSIVQQTVPYFVQAGGQVSSSIDGDPNAFIAFEVGSDPMALINVPHDDFFSTGLGRDEIGGPGADTFDITEPVPPSNAPTSPGPEYVFDGGVATNPTGTYRDGDIWDVNYSFSRRISIVIPDPSNGGLVVGRLKIAENTSPLPRSRVFFNYSLFTNVPLVRGGTTVNRFSPGFERANADGTFSFEMRAPFAATVDTSFIADSGTASRDVEWGNLFLAVKQLVARGPGGAISLGMALTVPTAADLKVNLSDGTPLARINNEAVHIMPFLGWLHVPSERFFLQGFLQLDVDANGNSASINPRGDGLVKLGRVQAPTFLYVDAGIGYWLYRNPGSGRVAGVVPMLEIHYNRSLQSNDTLISNGFQIGGGQTDIQQLNALVGCAFQLGNRTTATLGYATPLGNGPDQMFDGELRVLLNRFY